jgi:hypothetical protein
MAALRADRTQRATATTNSKRTPDSGRQRQQRKAETTLREALSARAREACEEETQEVNQQQEHQHGHSQATAQTR